MSIDKSELTKSEKEVLLLLTDEFLTVQQIAIRRKTSIRAVQKTIKSLKEKGALNIGSQKVRFSDGSGEPPRNGMRLHAEQWLIKILNKDERYNDLVGKSIRIDDNTVRLHRDVIVIYSNKHFYGSDTWATTAKSIDYWNSFFTKLEWKFKIILVKRDAENIDRVRAEYAQIKNGLAVKCEREAEKIRIRTREDGKVWFEIDNSFNYKEAETKHRKTAERDMQTIIEPYFNDMRDNEIDLPSDTKTMIKDLAEIAKNMIHGQKNSLLIEQEYAKNMKRHVSVMANIDKSFKKFTKLLSERQKKLGEWL